MLTAIHTPLAKPLRTQLENTVKAARDIAETAARAALQQLAVGEGRAPDYLNDAQRALRRRLRAHGRSLGDAKRSDDDTQELRRLVWEVAYEHWHRMLFARFLAENGLLLWEPGAAVSLQDCREMVDHHPEMAMGARSEWELAGKLAARMLPQVFKPQHPVFELVFAPEHQRELERLLSSLPSEVFQASDSLGWVYQFWQARRKDEVNASEVKIGADELPAVTQLFTEPYMVDFLLHNSLGAWWLTRHPDTPCPVPLTYLRTLEDGTPAAGKFEGWPDTLADFKLLDPCCGSGHFLVAAFLLLVPMRMAAEHFSACEAVDAVLRDNLHGLELDPRCVEIAVFALALAAWRFPDEVGQPLGVRADMPAPNIACCGLKVAARAADWMALVPDEVPNAVYLRQELRLLHDSFSQAPLLGSLLDPARSLKNDLATTSFDTLRDLLERALSTERPATLWGEGNEVQDEAWDHALTARGLLDAARLLDARYQLVVTNVPYLARTKQVDVLKEYCAKHYPNAKNDLANVFLERCLAGC
ncbi:DNA methyltransferase [Thauera aromatica]|uniref:site-specific DNA-methyltransferase (adenine-specific) n=1 Tax=Thauera aromatica K172 TaxID=44139 RepID=A0A2R4BNM4_THAAR|nr:DNA methyltransferase [Thauera aromatica]AVR88947.1 Type II restriction enzyme, methylase subunit [Thauera aromatica K172]